MDLHLHNKIVLITGGAKGIGSAIVRACAQEGAIPVIADKDATAAAQLQSALQQLGSSRVEFISTELTSPQACKSVVGFTLQKFNRLDANF